MRTSKEMKEEARNVIRDNRKKVMLSLVLFVVMLIVVGFVIGLIQGLVEGAVVDDSYATKLSDFESLSNDERINLYSTYREGYESNKLKTDIIDAVFQIIASIILSAVSYGFVASLIEIKKRGESGGIEYYGEGFSKLGKLFLKDLYVGLIAFCYGLLLGVVFSIVGFLVGGIAQSVHPVIAVIIGTLILVPLIVWIILQLIRYTMAVYLIHKDPELTGVKAAKLSAQLITKERAKKFFGLQVSFIGWYLLYIALQYIGYSMLVAAIFTNKFLFIIGGLLIVVTTIVEVVHLTPYTQMASIVFWDDVMEEEQLYSAEEKKEEELV